MARMISILLILLMASPAWAFPPVMMGKTASGGAATSCTEATLQMSETTRTSAYDFGKFSNQMSISSEIVYSGTTGTLCSLHIYLNCAGTCASTTGTATISLYDDNSGVPGNKLTDCGTIAGTALTTSSTEYTFNSCNTTVTNGLTYHIVVSADVANATNYLQVNYDNTCTTEVMNYKGSGEWASLTTANCMMWKMYIKE